MECEMRNQNKEGGDHRKYSQGYCTNLHMDLPSGKISLVLSEYAQHSLVLCLRGLVFVSGNRKSR